MSSLPHDTIKKCEDVFKVTPKDMQLQVINSVGHGQDAILIAGCGWGKSLVYFLPLVLWNNRIIVVISPLKALMKEQSQKLQDLDIPSISLDSSTQTGPNLNKQLAGGAYRAVFMTPELIFGSKRVESLWDIPEWGERLLAIVVDEAHCVSTWSKEFRPSYGELGNLRSKVPPGVAFVALSATLPPKTLEEVMEVLYFKATTRIFNAGNDRPNIRLEVRQLKPGENFKCLDFLMDFKKTIVYFERILDTVAAFNYLTQQVPLTERSKIAVYYSFLSDECKEMTMRDFKQDRILILLATEAVGMGCDVSNVVRVVQFKHPDTLLSLVQRLGRAARDPRLQGIGILFASSSTQITYNDQDLERYITTNTCRRKILDEVFLNESQVNANCCDICHPLQESFHPIPNITFMDVTTGHDMLDVRVPRTIQEKDTAKENIMRWRSIVFERDFKQLGDFYIEEHVMSDELVKKLGDGFGKVMSSKDIRKIISWTPLDPTIEEELADMLVKLNQEIDNKHQRKHLSHNTSSARSSRNVQAAKSPESTPKRPIEYEFINSTPEDFSKRGRKSNV